jgi:5-methylcytosine-specific restriction enzyme subunit McrC
MIHRAVEGETTWLPGLSPAILPYPLPKGISVYLRREKLGLESQGLVGAIPLLNGDTLQIIPKIGRVNFLRLLFKAEGLQPDLEREYDEFVYYSVDNEENIDHLVARQLMFSAAEIMKRGPRQGRIRRVRVGQFALGQIDAVSTALNIATRKQEPVVYAVLEKTLDIPENRALTEAILRAWSMLDDDDRVNFRGVYDRWLNRFPVSTDFTADLDHIERSFAAGQYGGSRDYYRRALMLAQIILGSSGLGFSEAATIQGDAVLLSTPAIFEKYLRNIISGAYSEAGYVISSGGIGVTSLYTDGSYELRPDIVVSKDNVTILIADAKYKQPTAADHYQMHTYLAANRLKRGLLLAPLYEGTKVVVREYATSDKVIVNEAYLPMADLDVTEAFLRSVVQKFS